VNVLSDS